MSRPHRILPAGYCYHILNRGNARQKVFHKEADYIAFLKLLNEAQERCAMRVLAFCLMPNHFHFVLRPYGDGDVSRWMQWILTTHVRRYHKHYETCGHVWQGRFKSFPIEADEHLLTVLRYVERNPYRAGLTHGINDWRWNSLRLFANVRRPVWYDDGPVPRGTDWLSFVEQPQTEAELLALRHSLEHGVPYGSDAWQNRTIEALGLESTLCQRGRPKKR